MLCLERLRHAVSCSNIEMVVQRETLEGASSRVTVAREIWTTGCGLRAADCGVRTLPTPGQVFPHAVLNLNTLSTGFIIPSFTHKLSAQSLSTHCTNSRLGMLFWKIAMKIQQRYSYVVYCPFRSPWAVSVQSLPQTQMI